MRKASVAIVVALAALMAAPGAHADAIDGDWCSAAGLSLTIRGPRIRTPSGIDTAGQYSRHAFSYAAPPEDPDSGQMLVMELIHEELMRLVRIKGGVPGSAEEWRRCNVTSALQCHRRIYSGDPWCLTTGLPALPSNGSPQHVRG